jgi:hypothetical protein
VEQRAALAAFEGSTNHAASAPCAEERNGLPVFGRFISQAINSESRQWRNLPKYTGRGKPISASANQR